MLCLQRVRRGASRRAARAHIRSSASRCSLHPPGRHFVPHTPQQPMAAFGGSSALRFAQLSYPERTPPPVHSNSGPRHRQAHLLDIFCIVVHFF
ncbi:hypothetical protein PENSPDRAFT_650006, partial [Peniophora sp. CONT]